MVGIGLKRWRRGCRFRDLIGGEAIKRAQKVGQSGLLPDLLPGGAQRTPTEDQAAGRVSRSVSEVSEPEKL